MYFVKILTVDEISFHALQYRPEYASERPYPLAHAARQSCKRRGRGVPVPKRDGCPSPRGRGAGADQSKKGKDANPSLQLFNYLLSAIYLQFEYAEPSFTVTGNANITRVYIKA